jgi:hypothetical protein
MAVSVTGIVINVVILAIIIGLIVVGLMFNTTLRECENEQSPYCYTIQCPCDVSNGTGQAPCFGYAKRPGPENDQWYCSNAPLTLVDANGNPVS